MNTERIATALADRYRIESRLGEGGMATVYLAFDLRHDRRVALKVLKPELAAVLGAERFVQEIKTTANLQHPHILPLFDSGRAGELLFYVMPFIEGETLRQRLDRETQLGIEEAVRLTREVADALDYAHRHGVIHRDIKPENILLQDGRALVADFGIALAVSAAAGGRMTETGLSLGTPHYMSPEQATAEKELTPRSDVYSLGSVLYEMLAGEPPHTGGSAQAVIMKIVTDRARPVSELRRSVPPNVAAAVAKSLEKLAADRFETAKAFSEALANPGFTAAPMAVGVSAASAGDRWKRIALGLGVATAASLVVAALALFRPSAGQPVSPTLRATIELPQGTAVDYQSLAFSADGSRLYAVVRKDGERGIWERRLGEADGRVIPGTEDGSYPFTSADGQSLLFRPTNSGLIRIPVGGGPAVTLDPLGNLLSPGTWGPDGSLYYGRNYKSGLWRLKPGSSEPEPVTTPDSASELGHWSPQMLPGGRHILFTAFRTPLDSARLEVLDLESGDRKVVLRGGITPVYARGFLVFARAGTLLAARFDLDRLEVVAEPVPVVRDLAVRQIEGLAAYAVSSEGTLAFISATDFDVPNNLVWVDRTGRKSLALPAPGTYDNPALSPEGRRLAVSLVTGNESADIWVINLASGARTRLTAGGGMDFLPVWTPDGRSLVYVSERPIFDIYTRPADASEPARPFLVSGFDKFPGSFSPDGRELLFDHSMLPYNQIWRASALGRDSALVLAGEGPLQNPALSPDGKWLLFETNENGRRGITVVTYPDVARARRVVSSDGGSEPRWTKGGREIIWRDGNRVLSASFDLATGEASAPAVLFTGDFVGSLIGGRGWDVTADGERFLFVERQPNREPRRIHIVTNWVQGLRDKVGSTP